MSPRDSQFQQHGSSFQFVSQCHAYVSGSLPLVCSQSVWLSVLNDYFPKSSYDLVRYLLAVLERCDSVVPRGSWFDVKC